MPFIYLYQDLVSGLRSQVSRHVHFKLKYFGGDANKVTVIRESAGGGALRGQDEPYHCSTAPEDALKGPSYHPNSSGKDR